MTFVLPEKILPTEVKLHYARLRLKGYAVKNPQNGLTYGYFRSQKPSIRIFDPQVERKKELLINYRDGGRDYSTLWGFKYHPRKRIIRCGLDSVVTTILCDNHLQIVDVAATPPSRRDYETKFLSAVAQSLTQMVNEIESASPLDSESSFSDFKIRTYPEDFQEDFSLALRDSRAFSLKALYVSVCLEHLGVEHDRKTKNSAYTPMDVCGGAYHRPVRR